MNRYTIEKRDKDVLEKFRAVVASKTQRKRVARIRLFSVLLVLAGVGGIIFYMNFSQTRLPETAMNQSKTIALNQPSGKNAIPDKGTDSRPSSQEVRPLPAITEVITPLSPEPYPPANGSVIPEKRKTPRTVPVLTPHVKTSGKIGLPGILAQPVRETDIRIAKILTCRGIKNKQAVSPQHVFSLQNDAKPYVWMDVRSKETPYRLRHVYYHNDRRYCVVPLAIRYPRMRTWSNVTLRYPYEAGSWRVDVVTKEGKKLSQVEFTVTP